MPSDAKLGLVVGIVLVIAVSVVFFSKDGKAGPSPALAKTTASLTDNPVVALSEFFDGLTTGGKKANLPPPTTPPVNAIPSPRVHEVREGDTLFALAEKYYGDGERFFELYKANRDVLASPDRLPPGSKLRIP